MRVLDSRRLTGPSLLLDGPGAILEVALDGIEPGPAIAAWRAALAPLFAALGWSDSVVVARAHPGGLNLAFSAPADVLYAATEVNEAAWRSASRSLGGAADGAPLDPQGVPAEPRSWLERERKP